jgi:hypothetical protein
MAAAAGAEMAFNPWGARYAGLPRPLAADPELPMKPAALLALLALPAAAGAQVVYSHYDFQNLSAVVAPGWEVGEMVTLAGGPAAVGRAEFQFAGLLPTASEGTLTVTFALDGGGQPGTTIGRFSQPVQISGAGPIALSFATGSLSVPASFWVSVYYEQTTGTDPFGVAVFAGQPTVGSVSTTRVFRNANSGPWSSATVSDWMSMRLTAGAGCYANCDGSTVQPILNVNDFVCFQTKYAAGDTYANCDGSTVPPVLNVNDFVCFQTRYAAGCP